MALEDLELVLWHDRFAPRKPELRRGNVARCASGGQEFRGLPRILVVSPYLPFPLSHGGAVRIYNLCRELAGSYDFILACFREANERVHYDELHRIFREVHVVDIDEKKPDPTVPSQVCEYRNSAMRSLITSLCHERRIELAFEGHRFFDIRRWKIAGDIENRPIRGMRIVKNVQTGEKTYIPVVLLTKNPWEEKMNLLPIATDEIRRNPDLQQAPGW